MYFSELRRVFCRKAYMQKIRVLSIYCAIAVFILLPGYVFAENDQELPYIFDSTSWLEGEIRSGIEAREGFEGICENIGRQIGVQSDPNCSIHENTHQATQQISLELNSQSEESHKWEWLWAKSRMQQMLIELQSRQKKNHELGQFAKNLVDKYKTTDPIPYGKYPEDETHFRLQDLHSNYEMLQLLDASSKKLELERLKIQSYFVNKNKKCKPRSSPYDFQLSEGEKNLCQLKEKIIEQENIQSANRQMIYDKYPLLQAKSFQKKLKKNNEWCSSNGISQLQQALINSFGQDEDKKESEFRAVFTRTICPNAQNLTNEGTSFKRNMGKEFLRDLQDAVKEHNPIFMRQSKKYRTIIDEKNLNNQKKYLQDQGLLLELNASSEMVKLGEKQNPDDKYLLCNSLFQPEAQAPGETDSFFEQTQRLIDSHCQNLAYESHDPREEKRICEILQKIGGGRAYDSSGKMCLELIESGKLPPASQSRAICRLSQRVEKIGAAKLVTSTLMDGFFVIGPGLSLRLVKFSGEIGRALTSNALARAKWTEVTQQAATGAYLGVMGSEAMAIAVQAAQKDRDCDRQKNLFLAAQIGSQLQVETCYKEATTMRWFSLLAGVGATAEIKSAKAFAKLSDNPSLLERNAKSLKDLSAHYLQKKKSKQELMSAEQERVSDFKDQFGSFKLETHPSKSTLWQRWFGKENPDVSVGGIEEELVNQSAIDFKNANRRRAKTIYMEFEIQGLKTFNDKIPLADKDFGTALGNFGKSKMVGNLEKQFFSNNRGVLSRTLSEIAEIKSEHLSTLSKVFQGDKNLGYWGRSKLKSEVQKLKKRGTFNSEYVTQKLGKEIDRSESFQKQIDKYLQDPDAYETQLRRSGQKNPEKFLNKIKNGILVRQLDDLNRDADGVFKRFNQMDMNQREIFLDALNEWESRLVSIDLPEGQGEMIVYSDYKSLRIAVAPKAENDLDKKVVKEKLQQAYADTIREVESKMENEFPEINQQMIDVNGNGPLTDASKIFSNGIGEGIGGEDKAMRASRESKKRDSKTGEYMSKSNKETIDDPDSVALRGRLEELKGKYPNFKAAYMLREYDDFSNTFAKKAIETDQFRKESVNSLLDAYRANKGFGRRSVERSLKSLVNVSFDFKSLNKTKEQIKKEQYLKLRSLGVDTETMVLKNFPALRVATDKEGNLLLEKNGKVQLVPSPDFFQVLRKFEPPPGLTQLEDHQAHEKFIVALQAELKQYFGTHLSPDQVQSIMNYHNNLDELSLNFYSASRAETSSRGAKNNHFTADRKNAGGDIESNLASLSIGQTDPDKILTKARQAIDWSDDLLEKWRDDVPRAIFSNLPKSDRKKLIGFFRSQTLKLNGEERRLFENGSWDDIYKKVSLRKKIQDVLLRSADDIKLLSINSLSETGREAIREAFLSNPNLLHRTRVTEGNVSEVGWQALRKFRSEFDNQNLTKGEVIGRLSERAEKYAKSIDKAIVKNSDPGLVPKVPYIIRFEVTKNGEVMYRLDLPREIDDRSFKVIKKAFDSVVPQGERHELFHYKPSRGSESRLQTMDPIFFPSEKQLFQYGLSALVYRIFIPYPPPPGECTTMVSPPFSGIDPLFSSFERLPSAA